MIASPAAPSPSRARTRPTPRRDLAVGDLGPVRAPESPGPLEPGAAPVAAVARPFDAGALIDARALESVADAAERTWIHGLVDEVYPVMLGGAPPTPATWMRAARAGAAAVETDQR